MYLPGNILFHSLLILRGDGGVDDLSQYHL